jgi:hypothetical protein
MGEARRKAQARARLRDFEPIVARVSAALRKLATAAGAQLGSDCYMHAELGRVLLSDLGVDAHVVIGLATWRIGAADGDVIGHTPYTQGYVAAGAKGLVYHAWLECRGIIIDLTTYQFGQKARALDAADGGHTTVLWCPDYLMLLPHEVSSYSAVAQAPNPGVAFYEARPELEERLPREPLDPADLELARWVLANPDIHVVGPNTASAPDPRVLEPTAPPSSSPGTIDADDRAPRPLPPRIKGRWS